MLGSGQRGDEPWVENDWTVGSSVATNYTTFRRVKQFASPGKNQKKQQSCSQWTRSALQGPSSRPLLHSLQQLAPQYPCACRSFATHGPSLFALLGGYFLFCALPPASGIRRPRIHLGPSSERQQKAATSHHGSSCRSKSQHSGQQLHGPAGGGEQHLWLLLSNSSSGYCTRDFPPHVQRYLAAVRKNARMLIAARARSNSNALSRNASHVARPLLLAIEKWL